MKLHILGSTGYHPNNQRHTACLMLPELGVALDAGTGLFRARELLQTPTLDIFLTHAHLDHSLGLTFLFDVLWEKRLERVWVHAEPDKIAALKEHLFAPLLFPAKPPFEWRELAPLVELPQEGRLTWFPLQHPGGSVGFRLGWPDRSLAYVTDTTARADAEYIRHIENVDVLIHECYFPDGWEKHAELTGHSCVTPVAQVAKAAKVGVLILVHVNPLSEEADPIGLETARAIFPATEIAEDRMEIEF